MGLWVIAIVLLIVWLAGLILGKGGFIHILLLCALSIALVQWIAEHRGRQAAERMKDEG
ncbi:MAG: lmo0937 family membrane protein [Pyrinomonadaceae bacterium]